MKKLFILAIGAMMLMACGGSQGKSESEMEAQRQLDSLRAVNANQARELDDFMEMANQVEEGFRLIKEAEGRVDIKDGNLEGVQKEQITSDMLFIQQTMQQNRELIDQLKSKLSKSNTNLSSLQKHIESLEAQMREQNERIKTLEAQLAERDQIIMEQGQQIADQGKQIDDLNENVSNLTTENEQKAAEVAAQDKELNKAWFVFGTKDELKEQRILNSGDVLKSSDFNKGYFTEVDIRRDKDIRFYSKNAKLLTNHPAGTYQLVKDAKGEYELHITNPQQFWSVSKYLVVLVK